MGIKDRWLDLDCCVRVDQYYRVLSVVPDVAMHCTVLSFEKPDPLKTRRFSFAGCEDGADNSHGSISPGEQSRVCPFEIGESCVLCRGALLHPLVRKGPILYL
jgi:hypothetical protein